MRSRRIEDRIGKAKYGPSVNEVFFGAALSLVLGAVLAAVYLMAIPAEVVRELPKVRDENVVYYVEGSKDANQGKQWMRKKQLFLAGSSVSVNEDELNAWITAEIGPQFPSPPPRPVSGTKSAQAPRPPPPKPASGTKSTQAPRPSPPNSKSGAKAPEAPPPPPAPLLQIDVPNFRVRDGAMQIGCQAALNLDLVGISLPLVAQVTGRFEKRDGEFAFVAERSYLGSFPLHKVPGLERLTLGKVLARMQIPEDIRAAWKKLANVTIEGNSLNLSKP